MVGKDLCILEESFNIILKLMRSHQKTSIREVHDLICTLERSFWRLCGEWTKKEGTGRTEVSWKAITIFYTRNMRLQIKTATLGMARKP